MINLGKLNKYAMDKFELAKQLREDGFPDELITEIIKNCEKNSIEQETLKGGGKNGNNS